MTTTYTNRSNLALSVATWLAHDTYDHNPDKNHFSATDLLKPIKQLVLATRVPASQSIQDISGLVASRMGTAIHDSIEEAWVGSNRINNLIALGIPKGVAKRIVVNPVPSEVTDDQIPVYLEQRSTKSIEGFNISGKFDFIGEGRVEDFKTTSVYTYIHRTNDAKYIMQGSIYRWLNPDIITRDDMAIQFIFTDWSARDANIQKNYPPAKTLEHKLLLKPLLETEAFIRNKLKLFVKYKDAPEEAMPACTDEDLWRKDTVWKYYSKLDAKRATKNFDNPAEANAMASMKGGITKEVKGKVVACRYCASFPVCKQKDDYLRTGDLEISGG
jgi:hypothetical protein